MNKILFVILVISTIIVVQVATVTSSEDWSLKVIYPQQNSMVNTPYLYIRLNARDFRFDIRYAGTQNFPDVGHYDKIIDGRLIEMSGRQNDAISMVGITPGLHLLTLVPARNNNTELTESAVDIPFTYTGAFLPQPGPFYFDNPPSLAITSPANGTTVEGAFYMQVDIQNFVLSGESFGKELVDGVGHWQIYVDLHHSMMNCTCEHGDPAHMEHMMMMLTHLKAEASTYSQQVYLKGLEPNMYHNFTAILVDNQHMHVMPMVMDTVSLYVSSID